MKKILSLTLALLLILPMLFACGNSGTPTNFTNVQIINRKDPMADLAQSSTTESASSNYTEYLFGENKEPLTVSVPEGGATAKDVVLAYDSNAAFEGNDLISLKNIENGDGYYWGVKVDGKDCDFSAPVQPDSQIIIDFAK